MSLDPLERVMPLIGRWSGIARVWFEPPQLADESPVEGEVRAVLGSRFVEWVYRGTLQGKPLEGRLLLGWYPMRRRWEAAWIDSFHMGRGILLCHSDPDPDAITVLGHYSDGQGGPDWGWRTTLTPEGTDAFALRAWNLDPTGAEYPATEALLRRVD